MFAIWVSARRLPRCRREEISILVVIRYAGSGKDRDAVEGVLERLAEQIEEEARRNISDNDITVRVRRLPPHIRIGDHETALNVLNKCQAAYLIWANSTYGNIGGQEVIQFSEINFTVRHRRVKPQFEAEFHTDLGSLPTPSRTLMTLSNDVLDTATVARDLSRVARYQLGLAFTDARQVARLTCPAKVRR